MRYLGDDEATQLRGIDLYQGTDGNLYEWVEGVDEWGEQELSQAEDPALSGLGALYQAPDGTLYQMHGLAERRGSRCGGNRGEDSRGETIRQGPTKASGFRRRPRLGRRRKGGFFKKLLLPIAKFATGFIPGAGRPY